MRNIRNFDFVGEHMSKQRDELDSALETLQNEMRETLSKLNPEEMIWLHQPPGMRPILCKEPVAGAVPFYTVSLARKPLTDEEINSIGDKIANEKLVGPVMDFRIRLARAIERAHGIGEP